MEHILKKHNNYPFRATKKKALKHHSIETELFTLPPAKMSSRFYAFLIDSIFFSAISEGVSFLIGAFLREEDRELMASLAVLMTFYAYFVFPIKKWGYTPGKKVLGLRVLSRTQGQELRLRNLIFRQYFGMPLSFLPLGLGYLMGAISKDKLTLHDRLSGTKVIQEEINENQKI